MRKSRANALRKLVVLGVMMCCAAALLPGSAAVGTSPTTPMYSFYDAKLGNHFYTADPTERDAVINNMISRYTPEGAVWPTMTSNPASTTPLFRLYNKKNGEHFYTVDPAERSASVAQTGLWSDEGTATLVLKEAGDGGQPVWRFCNKKNGSHFYTSLEIQKDSMVSNLGAVWKLEGVGFYVGGLVR